MTSTDPTDQPDTKASRDDKPTLVASTDPPDPSNDHGSQEGKLEESAFYNSTASNPSFVLTGAEEKKLLRRIDWHLLPLLAAMYVVKTINAQNVSHLTQSCSTQRLVTDGGSLRCRMLVPWIKTQYTTS
jgi:hypothetical protein